MTKHNTGVIHGRFQPFHNGHLAYALEASEICETLVVGITTPEPENSLVEQSDSHRHLRSANPFSFIERLEMIQESLLDHLPERRFIIVPFDVSKPELWANYLPHDAVQIVTVHEEWDMTKADRFTKYGYLVVYLKPNLVRITGTQVRELLRAGSTEWLNLVPPGTRLVIQRNHLDSVHI